MDADARSLRVLTFRPSASAATVDSSLRDEVITGLCARREVVDAYVARDGGDAGDRVVATVWGTPPDGDVEIDLLRRSLPADVDALADARLDGLPLCVAARFERDDPPGVLRVFRGTTRPGELDAYIDEARTGMLADAQVNQGLIAFYLGRQGPDTFVTVSAWTGWDAIESATGGNHRRPFATRQADRLVAFTVDHYEVLPDTSRPLGAPTELRPDPAAPPELQAGPAAPPELLAS